MGKCRSKLSVVTMLLLLPHVSSRACEPVNGMDLAKCNDFTDGKITIILSPISTPYELKESLSLTKPSHVTIIGNGAGIKCINRTRLILCDKLMVNISNITISDCGNFTLMDESQRFKVAISVFIKNCSSITVNEVIIENSFGIGLALINCSGTIMISDPHSRTIP